MARWFLLLLVAAVTADATDKNRPVTKVINLLKDMQKTLAKEAEEDEAAYNKMACWCTTNDKEKSTAIADAEAKISQLVATIEELTGTASRLNTEIENLNKEIADNQKALDQATQLRKKQLADFNAEEKDSIQSISALKQAITVLSKHHRSFMQMSASDAPIAMVSIARILNHISFSHPDMLLPAQQKVVQSYIQSTKDYFDDKSPEFEQSYAPQSGEIFGILNNMKETFETNLSASQKDELAAQAAFEDLKKAKETEIAEGQAHVSRKNEELATTQENNAQAKEDLENTRNSLSADQKFLMNLKEKCEMTDQEWAQRQKTRAEENVAVAEALKILAGDDAHDNFGRTFNFAQKTLKLSSNRREAAAKVLNQAALTLNKPKLATLATSVRLDAFVRVKKAIDEMVSALLKEKADEIKQKDFCTSELNANDKEEASQTRKKEDLEAKIDQLNAEIETLKNEIETLQSEIANLNTELKRASENREADNVEFQKIVADQRATQSILTKAMDKLKGFYAKKDMPVLAQEPAGPAPPAGFKTYKNNSAAGGVMGLIQQIIDEAKVLEKEAVTAEKDAQAAYEGFVKDTNESIMTKNTEATSKQSSKAGKEIDLAERTLDHENTLTSLEQLANTASALHKSCDFTLKNFDVRQTARDQEVEALRNAKAILSGSKFAEFLQRA